jgi:hypothetical protein
LWVIAVLAALAILLCFILYIPLDLLIHVDVDGRPKFRLSLSWLFGLVRPEITGREKKPKKKIKKAKAKKKHRLRDARLVFNILRTRGILRHVRELVKGVFSAFKFRDIVADLKIGLGDPVDTGLLFAFLGPATALWGSSHLHRVRLEPSLDDDAVLQGYLQGTVRLRPIRLVPPLLKFVFSLTTLKIVKTVISSKWKRKK